MENINIAVYDNSSLEGLYNWRSKLYHGHMDYFISNLKNIRKYLECGHVVAIEGIGEINSIGELEQLIIEGRI